MVSMARSGEAGPGSRTKRRGEKQSGRVQERI